MSSDGVKWYPLSLDLEAGYGEQETAVRHGFMQKVFGLLTLQLCLTATIGVFIISVTSIKNWIFLNSWFLLLTFIASFAFLIILTCVPDMQNKYPHNLILLFSFTACEGVLVGCISATYDINEVVLAAVITVGVTAGLTAFALQTKIDFTLFSGILFSILLVLCMSGFISVLFPPNNTFSIVYASIGAALFSCYLVYDVQMIAGGHKHELGPDDYIQAALHVYLDIINLFLMILRLIGQRR